MPEPPEIRFLSLFVPDVAAAAQHYETLLGGPPVAAHGRAPDPHPFAGSEPVVFELGTVLIALYQANPNRGTHPGDVGIGVRVDAPPSQVAERARSCRAQVLYGPKRVPGDGRTLAVVMLPDRHFFELVDR